MLWKGSQVPRSLGNVRKRTKTRPWRKRQSKSLKFSFHKYFTTCFYLFLFFNYFTLSFFFYTFFTHDIYPHPHPWPATHTHDPRHLATLVWHLWCSGQGVACTCRWTRFDSRRCCFLFLCTVFFLFNLCFLILFFLLTCLPLFLLLTLNSFARFLR